MMTRMVTLTHLYSKLLKENNFSYELYKGLYMPDISAQKQKKNKSPWTLVFVTIVALLIGVGLFYMGRFTSPPQPSSATQLTATTPQGNTGGERSNDQPIQSGTTLQARTEAPTEDIPVTDEAQSIIDKEPATFNPVSEFQPTQAAVADSVKELDDFFDYLDQQTYIKTLHLPSDTKITFGTLIQKLVNNPPVITGESDDLYTLLKNTAHFFRVLGGSNIQLLKTIVTHDEPQLEDTAAEIFVLLNDQQALQEHYNITLPETALYDYSCFLMNTMGGRLYMFRRDLELRMLINYYSILFANQAQQEGRNRHGIDIRPFLINLIDQMENYGQNLKMRDSYLETLYLLEKQWE